MWKLGVGRAGESNGGEMRTAVIEQELKRERKRKRMKIFIS